MDISWLEDFIALANTANFTRAAKERNVTQSAFSRRIKALESWLGVELVDRKTYPVALSPCGENFLPVARSTVFDLLRTRDEMREQGGRNGGLIRFAAPHTISVHHLAPLLHEIAMEMPQIQTRVISDNLHDCCEALTNDLCNFLMCYRHKNIKLMLDEALYSRIDLLHEWMVPVCSPKLDGTTPLWNLDAATQEKIPYLAYTPGSFLGVILEELKPLKAERFIAKHSNAYAEALKSLAINGAGVAWLPQHAISKELQRQELVFAGSKSWAIELTLSTFTNVTKLDASSKEIWKFFQTKSSHA